jgi:hypothetical protein
MDLAVLIIMIEMSIGFLAGIGYYPNDASGESVDYLRADQGGVVSTFQKNITDEDYVSNNELGIGDYLKFGLDWLFASWNMLIMVVKAFVGISFLLYTQFNIPIQLCVFIQGIVWLIYTWGFIQWRSGRGGKAFE